MPPQLEHTEKKAILVAILLTLCDFKLLPFRFAIWASKVKQASKREFYSVCRPCHALAQVATELNCTEDRGALRCAVCTEMGEIAR